MIPQKKYKTIVVKSADETGSDQEARNDDAYALFGRLSSTRIPNKKEKKSLCYVSLSLRYIGRIVLLLDQINIIKSWILCYNLQGDKIQKSTLSRQMKQAKQSFF